jgi:hypothetical protein
MVEAVASHVSLGADSNPDPLSLVAGLFFSSGVVAEALGMSGGSPSHSSLPVPSSPSSPLRAPAEGAGNTVATPEISVSGHSRHGRAEVSLGGCAKFEWPRFACWFKATERPHHYLLSAKEEEGQSTQTAARHVPASPPSGAKEFINKLTRPAGGILRAPVRRPRQGKATTTEVVPRRSRRVAGVGVERLPPPPPAKQGKKRILKELGIVNAGETETIRPEDLDEYARVFRKGLSEVQITAMAALFGWSRPKELLQGGPIC